MKQLWQFFLVFLFGITLFACSSGNVRIGQLLFNESLGNAYYDGKLYTGEAWSDDGKTICICCDNGKVNRVKVYHSNGNIALDNTSLVGAGKAYDRKGNEISMELFAETYPGIISKIQEMINGMYCSPELK